MFIASNVERNGIVIIITTAVVRPKLFEENEGMVEIRTMIVNKKQTGNNLILDGS